MNKPTKPQDHGRESAPVAQVSSPVQDFKINRRTLPHIQKPGRIYFLTWRCRQGIFLTPEDRDLALTALLHYNDTKWKVYTTVILPDHVHVLAQPLPHPDGGVHNLADIVHSVKRFSVYQISKRRGANGSIWQDERYDRIVRDEAEFLEKWNYIRNNPVKGGLATKPEDYPWFYESS